MTIIKQGVTKIGEFWIKKTFPMTLDDDGEEHALAAMAYPAYVYPGYTWINYSVMSIPEMDPWATSECIIRGRHVNVPEGLPFSDNMTDLMEAVAPIDEAAADGDLEETGINVGITGRKTHELEGSERYTFVTRKHRFGLPNGAYPCNANAIRFTAFGKYEGHCSTKQMVDISQPHMIFMGALTEAANYSGNQSLAVYGDHDSFNDLYNSLVDLFKNEPTGHQSTDMLSDKLLSYQGSGFSTDDDSAQNQDASPDDIHDNADMFVRMKVTQRLDIYEPDDRSRVLAP